MNTQPLVLSIEARALSASALTAEQQRIDDERAALTREQKSFFWWTTVCAAMALAEISGLVFEGWMPWDVAIVILMVLAGPAGATAMAGKDGMVLVAATSLIAIVAVWPTATVSGALAVAVAAAPLIATAIAVQVGRQLTKGEELLAAVARLKLLSGTKAPLPDNAGKPRPSGRG